MAQEKPADAVTVKKKLPELRTDDEAEAFVEQADLTEYDLSHFKRVRFEFLPKSAKKICCSRARIRKRAAR